MHEDSGVFLRGSRGHAVILHAAACTANVQGLGFCAQCRSASGLLGDGSSSHTRGRSGGHWGLRSRRHTSTTDTGVTRGEAAVC